MINTQLVQVASNNSWLEATKLLIAAAQQNNNNVRSLTIKEDSSSQAGKFRLKARVL